MLAFRRVNLDCKSCLTVYLSFCINIQTEIEDDGEDDDDPEHDPADMEEFGAFLCLIQLTSHYGMCQ